MVISALLRRAASGSVYPFAIMNKNLTKISSAIIALCALGYTVWQGKQAQKHNKSSFRPRLVSWSNQDSSKGIYVVDIINNGLGPALIESFTIKIDGKVIAGRN